MTEEGLPSPSSVHSGRQRPCHPPTRSGWCGRTRMPVQGPVVFGAGANRDTCRTDTPTGQKTEDQEMELKPGSVWHSAVSSAQVIVVRAPSVEVSLTCGGLPMLGAA